MLLSNSRLSSVGELSLAMLQIIFPLAIIRIARLSIGNHTESMFLSSQHVALVNISVRQTNGALPVELPIIELPFVHLACISEVQLALSGYLPFKEFAFVSVSIWLLKPALTKFESVDKFSRICEGSILPLFFSLSTVDIVAPISLVQRASVVTKNAKAFCLAFHEAAHVNVSIRMDKSSFAIEQAIFSLACVNRPIRVNELPKASEGWLRVAHLCPKFVRASRNLPLTHVDRLILINFLEVSIPEELLSRTIFAVKLVEDFFVVQKALIRVN